METEQGELKMREKNEELWKRLREAREKVPLLTDKTGNKTTGQVRINNERRTVPSVFANKNDDGIRLHHAIYLQISRYAPWNLSQFTVRFSRS